MWTDFTYIYATLINSVKLSYKLTENTVPVLRLSVGKCCLLRFSPHKVKSQRFLMLKEAAFVS
jgi:hypothetical protein